MQFHKQLGRWESFDEFLSFNVHVERLLWQFGMFPWEKPEGIWSRFGEADNLFRYNLYSQSVWRRIQSIGDLRNNAAHGEGPTIDPEDVKDAHRFVQRFITDHPT